MIVDAKFPEKALPLFRPASYKIMYGGRGGSKTWDFCRALLILGTRRKLFILCAREIQKSISESVHRVLATQIDAMGLGYFYRVLSHKIIGINGTEFVFAGIRNNITAIKSMEGIDICAVFEATFVSQHSWDILLPTVRGDPPKGPFGQGSEVWVEFNPELGTDETYRRWVLNPPDGAIIVNNDDEARASLKAKAPGAFVIQVNWRDNPWFPKFLRKQMEAMRKADYENFLTIWEGQVRRVLQGAIYAKEIERATREHRISPHILVDRSKPVDLACDLGRGDMTSIWFFQQVGMEHHAVDYYGNFGFAWDHYLEQIQARKYIIGRIYLPHDGTRKVLEAKKSIFAQTVDCYPGDNRVVRVPRTSDKSNDINSVRMMFPRLFFNEQACADGLTALAHYRYEVNPEKMDSAGKPMISDQPIHDWASHASDGLACYVMGLRDQARRGPQMHMPQVPADRHDGLGWMAG